MYKELEKRFFSFWFYFLNCELLRCGLLSVVHVLETTFFGGEEVGRCSTLVVLGILGGCHTHCGLKSLYRSLQCLIWL
jgi:hypothetical protein